MKYIKKMFSDNNIDAKIYKTIEDTYYNSSSFFGITRFLIIEYEFGDEINGLRYNRKLSHNDCIYDVEETRKVIENDINKIKSALREVKLKKLGIIKNDF